MAATFPAPGDDIGRFRVLSQLGAGGMGVVYDALEVNLERRVALKVISPMFADDPDFRARFLSEARALASLDSSHVVQVYAHGEEDGFLYIATQLVPDGDLGQMLTRWGAAPLGKGLELIEQVAHGLSDAHAAGLVHRDIKPANVLVRRRGEATVQAYLGDFGIARRVDAEVTRLGGAAIGTPSYMAPELHGGAQASPASDVYSMGCLLWVALTGRPPYEGGSEFEIVGGHVSKPVPQLPSVSPLADHVNRILRTAMAKQPGERYPSAATLRQDLRSALRGSDDPAFSMLAASLPSSRLPDPRQAAPLGPPTPSGPTGPGPGFAAPTPTGGGGTGGYGPGGYGPGGYGTGGYGTGGYGGSSPVGTHPGGRGRRTGLWVALAAVGVAVVIGGGAALAARGGDDPEPGPVTGGGGTTAQVEPETPFAEEDPAFILSEAEKDTRALRAVRISGQIQTEGQEGTVDLTITNSGDCDGTLGLGGGSAQLRKLDNEAWLKPDLGFLQASGVDADTAGLLLGFLGERWLLAERAQVRGFNAFCDLDRVLEPDGSVAPVPTVDGTEQVGGAETVRIITQEAAGETVAYVSVEAPHYVRRIETVADGSVLDLDEFDVPLDVAAPADADVFDTATLED